MRIRWPLEAAVLRNLRTNDATVPPARNGPGSMPSHGWHATTRTQPGDESAAVSPLTSSAIASSNVVSGLQPHDLALPDRT